MKNIEKYPNTRTAMDAYNDWTKIAGNYATFDTWLEQEHTEPHEPTLLEAAKSLSKAWYSRGSDSNLNDVKKRFEVLFEAVTRESQRPLRNCDRYKTAKEAIEAFDKMFLSHCWSKCNGCPIGEQKVKVPTSNCMFLWLYAETEKEAGR